MFDEEFVNSLPKDTIEALSLICDEFLDFHERMGPDEETDYYREYLTAYSLLIAYSEVHKFECTFPPITRTKKSDINMIYDSFLSVRSLVEPAIDEKKYSLNVNEFKKMLGVVFHYEFSKDDIKRITRLIVNLKDVLKKRKEIDEDFRHRLMKKLENLENNIDLHMTSVDAFWGLFVDSGVALGKYGKEAKPVFDTFKEIMQLVWRTQAKAEELPPNAPVPMVFTGRTRRES